MTDAHNEASEQTFREVEQMIGEVMLFDPIMVQNYLHDEFTRDVLLITAFQHGAPIEVNITAATQLYNDLNNSVLRVRARIVDGADHAPDQNVYPSFVNNASNSMWRDKTLTLHGRQVIETNNMYTWRAYIKDLLNISSEVQNTRLDTQCWR